MTNQKCKYHPHIDQYMDDIRSEIIKSSHELKLAMDYIEGKLNQAHVWIDHEKIDTAVEKIEAYMEMELMDWELCIIALMHCYNTKNDTVIFDEFFIEMGRGNGKNGFISAICFYLGTHFHGVKGYNIDIIANNEDQAKTSFDDVYEMLEQKWSKLKKLYYRTKQKIVMKKTNSYLKYNTSNARTKDGKRSACLVFDEIHEYENYDTIKVFTSGFGKRKHSRTFYITTNGYIRGGVLDDYLELSKDVLNGEITDLGLLPLIYKIDHRDEYQDPDNWEKANPSIRYFPNLKKEIEKSFVKMKYQPSIAQDFMTKRMNYPAENNFTVVATWDKIMKTNRAIPYEQLEGKACIGAIDYARITDFTSVGLLFKVDGIRYWVEHTFVCHKALEVQSRPIKFPVQEAVDKGLITIIHRDSITASDVSNWFLKQAKKFNIINIYADSYRFSFLESKFTEYGLPLKEVRSGPVTHAKVAPLVESLFAEEKLVFGDNMTMRWYTNNTCTDVDGKGNTTYLKIEPQTRKTDGFFALIHALVNDSELVEMQSEIKSFDVVLY
ncbi:terminase TerL endonuclease subunit [Tindallia californiensis]|uniref:Phage terminase-like protein, large subunit, contains N-terminal HTH domain n=1 Tax=Tindallia californiensis TaxID=159292 RepID=A0A1H3R1R6_9FIRM|nr:terminase TerL endonuclease subunit [Tindallia californiensis]SDZ19168.1 Phage terminase-like protein, large subunit, contains N-terminal HTH domain [Tindallia californiensis]